MIKITYFLLIFSIQQKLLRKDFNQQRFLGEWYQIAHGEDHPYVEDEAYNVRLILRKLKNEKIEIKTRFVLDGSSDEFLREGELDESEEEVVYELKEV